MSEISNQIEVWLDIIGQINLFFNRALLFSACVAKAIRTDLSFCKYHWSAKDINMLLYSIEAYVEAAKLALNCCDKSFNLIN